MDSFLFAETIEQLNNGDHVNTECLRAFFLDANKIANTIATTPAYKLMWTDLMGLTILVDKILKERKRDQDREDHWTARAYEASITKPPLSDRVC